MKDNYVADIGDYGKYALLRHLTQQPDGSSRLGVVWYLTDHEEENNDGRHTDYLSDPAGFRPLDPDLFDDLADIIDLARRHERAEAGAPGSSGPTPRCVRQVQDRDLLGAHAQFFSECVQGRGEPKHARAQVRMQWWRRARAAVAGSDVVFLDPDNGLFPRGLTIDGMKADKSADPREVASLLEGGQAVVLYHHLDRTKGGWDVRRAELIHAIRQAAGGSAACVSVIRISVLSARGFLLLTPPDHEAADPLHSAMASFVASAVVAPRFKGRVYLDEHDLRLG